MSSSDTDTPMANAGDGELLVWPWTGVLAMASDDAAAAVSTLASHAEHHFAGVTSTALQEAAADDDDGRRRHFLVLHFGKSWAGLHDAMSLPGCFAGAGKRQWRRQQQHGESAAAADVVYGWAAGEEDLRGDGAVGRFLREAGAAARSAEDVAGDEASVAARFGAMAGEYERRAKFLEAKCEEAAAAAHQVEENVGLLHGELNELRRIVGSVAMETDHDIHEKEKLMAELDAARKEIDTRKEMIDDKHKGVLEINTLEMATGECKLDDIAPMLHENHKQEMEAIYAKLTQLEKQLERRQALESTIQQLNKKLQAGESLRKEDYEHIYNIKVCMGKILDEEKECLIHSCADIMKRVRMNSDELQENRQELIKGLENMKISTSTTIGIKRMGELDRKPFLLACKRKYKDNDPGGKASMLVSSWQDKLKNLSWHPFVTVQVDGEDKEVVDEDDSKLRQLQVDYGDNVCNAVKASLRELNEYNPGGRCPVNELWNFRERRKATTTEVVRYILEQLKTSSLQCQL